MTFALFVKDGDLKEEYPKLQSEKMAQSSQSKDRNSKGKTRGGMTPSPRKAMRNILSGGLLSSDFVNRHKLKFFLLFLFIIFYIATKYQCMTGMETIQSLNKELQTVKAERIRESSRYMSRIRESTMSAIADSVRPGLRVQQQPPYTLELKK